MAIEGSGANERAGPAARGPAAAAAYASRVLLIWVALVIALHAVEWVAGFREYVLASAIEQGAARVESETIGEVADEVVRKAIGIQQDTRSFWSALVALGDFGADPAALVLRALGVATAFAGIAALVGRPIGFADGLAACARAQGFWVLGLAVRVGLMIALRRPDVETSAVLLLDPGTYPATMWVAIQQLDAFALLGWGALATGGWRRGQVSLLAAVLICSLLAALEASLRTGWLLLLGAGMRLTLMPA